MRADWRSQIRRILGYTRLAESGIFCCLVCSSPQSIPNHNPGVFELDDLARPDLAGLAQFHLPVDPDHP